MLAAVFDVADPCCSGSRAIAAIQRPICSNSFAQANVVAAGVPKRMPLVTSAGLGSNGIMFLLPSAIQHDQAHALRFACDLGTGMVFAQRLHIHQHQMVVRAIADVRKPSFCSDLQRHRVINTCC